MSMRKRTLLQPRLWAALALLAGGALIASGAGFIVGRKWPIDSLERLFAGKRDPVTSGWTIFARTDLPRYEMIRVKVDRQLFVFGGFSTNKTEATARVEVLDLTTGAWQRKADMPVALTHTTGAFVRDTIWIAGGFEGNHPGPATARVWRYAIATDLWSAGPALPSPRGGGALVAFGDTLHFLGGWLADRNTDSPDHWILTPGAIAWESRAGLPVPRGHLSVIVEQGALYAIGGNRGHDPVPLELTVVHRYDPLRDVWTAVADLPKAVSHTEPATFAHDGRIITVGGRARPSGVENLNDIYAFEPAADRWTHLGLAPERMLGGLATVHHDTVIAGLGAPRWNFPETPYLWKAALRNSWWPSTPMPIALGEVAAGAIDRGLFVVGEGSLQTLRYDVARGDWSVVRDGVRPAPGHHHASEVIDGRWFLFGGLGGFSEGIVQIFEPTTGRWTLGPVMPFAAGSSASGVIGSRVYVAGGIVDGRTSPRMAVLDLPTMTWSEGVPMPRARNHAASGTDGTRLYVFGGRGPGSGDSNVVANGYDDVQIYDPATGRWTVSDGQPGSPLPLPQARGGTGKAVFVNGEFWVIGGETVSGAGATSNGVYARVDIYDPKQNRWREGPALTTARHGAFPVLQEGRLLVAGGGVTAGYSATSSVEVLWSR
jgi:N-acetylneuraminic acid mutarotase